MSDILTRRGFLETIGAAGAAASLAANAAVAATVPPGTRIVDCHVHLKHGDAAKTEWSADAIVEIMDKVGIQKSCVFAMSTTTARSIEMARAAVKKYPQRLIPFLYALPSYERPVLKEIEAAIANEGFRGIKVHAAECSLPDYIIDPVLRLAGSFPVPCLIDCSGNAAAAARMAEAFPNTTFLYAHMGKWMTVDISLIDPFIRVAEKYPNVYLDLSGVALVYKIEEAAKKLGADRLVWGTDGPHNNPNAVAYARAAIDQILELNLSDADKQKILGGNLSRLLNLS